MPNNGAYIAFVNILSNDASFCSLMDGQTGTNANVSIGVVPQRREIPAVTVMFSGLNPTDTKDTGISKMDIETVTVSYHANDPERCDDMALAGRLLLDGLRNVTKIIGNRNIQIEQSWLVSQRNIWEENTNKITYIFEQEFEVRVIK